MTTGDCRPAKKLLLQSSLLNGYRDDTSSRKALQAAQSLYITILLVTESLRNRLKAPPISPDFQPTSTTCDTDCQALRLEPTT